MRQGTLASLAVLALTGACAALKNASPDAATEPVSDGGAEAGDLADGTTTAPPDAAVPEHDREWAMWRLPASSPINADYAVTTGTVHDDRTALDWERTSHPTPSTWDEATRRCDGLVLEGRDDWRLPTRIELYSLVDYGRSAPSLNAAVFSASTEAGIYWSASLDAQAPSAAAWSVAFGAGESARAAMSTPQRSRCVRGDAPARVHYQVAADIVTDLWTGLAWQRRLANAGTMTWTDALLLCQGAGTGGRSGWRLPTARELESIVDIRAKAAPTLRATELATDDFSATLWSITSVAGAIPARSWAVDFTPGHTPTSLATGAGAIAAVRCVAGP